MKTILIAIDFEEQASMLIDQAVQLALQFNAKIWLVHIAAPEPDFVGFDVGPMYIREYRARELKTERRLMDKYVADIVETGVEAEGLLIDGVTVDLLAKKAVDLDADLLVVGKHEHGFLYRLWFGDTADQLVHTHTIPTLVVPL